MNLNNLNIVKVAKPDNEDNLLIPRFNHLLNEIVSYFKDQRKNNKIVIYGEPGTCKAALASQYAHTEMCKHPNLLVKWIDGSTLWSFLCDLRLLEIELGQLEFSFSNEKFDTVYDSIINKLNTIAKTINRQFNDENKHKNFQLVLIIENPDSSSELNKFIYKLERELHSSQIVKYLILTTENIFYQTLGLEKQIETKYFPLDSCFYSIKSELKNIDKLKLSLPDEILPVKYNQVFAMLRFNLSYSIQDINDFLTSKIDFLKVRCPKACEILICLSLLRNSNYISLTLIKEIFKCDSFDEITQALDFLIYHSLLLKSHLRNKITYYYLDKSLQMEVLNHINLNSFNLNFILNRIVDALYALLDDNNIVDHHNVLIFNQALNILKIKSAIPTETSFKLFSKIEKIKKHLVTNNTFNELEVYIETIFQNSNLLADFRRFSLNETAFEIIKKQLKNNSFIFDVKFNKFSDKWLKNNPKKQSEIDEILNTNFISYNRYPSDFIHGILSYYVNEYDYKKVEKSTDKVKFSDSMFESYFKFYEVKDQNKKNQEIEEYKTKINILLSDWRVFIKWPDHSFTCFIFLNNTNKQAVVAFAGFKFGVKDFFLNTEDNTINTVIKSLVANHKIPSQLAITYDFTKKAVELCNRKNYSLSFTGYSLGAWLAEQAVFFCHNDFQKLNVKSVTFDSPGSLEILEKLNQKNIKQYARYDLDFTDLNMCTYMSDPNIINTMNRHIGKVFFLKTSVTKNNQLNERKIEQEIESYSSLIHKFLKKNCNDMKFKIQFFHVKCLCALKIDNLGLMLHQFDLDTEKPSKTDIFEIKNWPKIEFNIDSNFDRNFSNLFSSGMLFNNIPGLSVCGQLVADVVDVLWKPLVKFLLESVLKGVSLIISIVIEFLNNNIQLNDLVAIYKHGFYNYISGSKNVDNLGLKYEARLEITYTDEFSRRLEPNNDNIDTYIENLESIEIVHIDKFIKNEFVNKQLKKLISLISFSKDRRNVKCILSKDKIITLETIKNIFEQLLIYDNNLVNFLRNLSNLEKIYEIKSDELNFDFKNLNQDENYQSEMDLALNTKQYLVLSGKSGSGKSVLAAQYTQHRLSYESNTIFKWIDCSEIQSIKNDLIKFNLNFDKNELSYDLDLAKLIDTIRMKINYNYFNYTFLFILDNVNNLDYIEEFTHGFYKNIQFIITTKTKIDDKDLNDNIIFRSLENLDIQNLVKSQPRSRDLYSSEYEYKFKLAEDKFKSKNYIDALNDFKNLIGNFNKNANEVNSQSNMLLNSYKYNIDCLLHMNKHVEAFELIKNLKDVNLICKYKGSILTHLLNTQNKVLDKIDLNEFIKTYNFALRILETEDTCQEYSIEIYFFLGLACQKSNQLDKALEFYTFFKDRILKYKLNSMFSKKLIENIEYINLIDTDLAITCFDQLRYVTSDAKLRAICFRNLADQNLYKSIINKNSDFRILSISLDYYKKSIRALIQVLQSVCAKRADYLLLARINQLAAKCNELFKLKYKYDKVENIVNYYIQSILVYQSFILNKYDDNNMNDVKERILELHDSN